MGASIKINKQRVDTPALDLGDGGDGAGLGEGAGKVTGAVPPCWGEVPLPTLGDEAEAQACGTQTVSPGKMLSKPRAFSCMLAASKSVSETLQVAAMVDKASPV